MTTSTPKAARWVLLASATALVAGFGAAQADTRPSAARPQAVAAPSAVPPSLHPSVSSDGRFVAYEADVALGSSSGNERRSVFLLDRQAGSITELTRLLPGLRAGDSVRPAVSADGCSVAVVTEIAYDLFRDDDRGDRWDVYRMVLPACGGSADSWELVSTSVSSGGGQSAADDASPLDTPAVSGAGTTIAYTHSFSSTAKGLTGITVVDLTVPLGEPGRTRPVAGTPSSDPDTVYNYRGLRQPAISDSGDVIAYTSDADSAAPVAEWAVGPAEGGLATSQVFVWDRTELDLTRAVKVVSVADGDDRAAALGHGAADPVLSADGRFVAFTSTSPDLVPDAQLPSCATRCVPQVYRYDRLADATVLASRRGADPDEPDARPVGADAGASQPTMTADGREIAYVTRATNLFLTRSGAGGGGDDGDIVAIDLTSGVVNRVSMRTDGSPAPAAQSSPHLSASGRVIVFDTLAGASFAAAPTGRQVIAIERKPTLAIDALDVGTVAVGFLGPEWFATLVNRGPSAFTPATITSTSPDFLVSDGGTCVPEVPVSPGGSCTVFVTMLPTKPGVAKGELVIAEAGYGATFVAAPLRGFGGDPSLRVDFPGADLGKDVKVGELGRLQTFTLTNIGFFPTQVGAVTLSGEAPDDFVITGGTCPRLLLAVNDTCTVDVVFAPKTSGERRAVVTVETGGGNYVTMQINGSSRYTPSMVLSADRVRQGGDVAVAGVGFAPFTKISLVFADGRGLRMEVTTDGAGNFLVPIELTPIERPGTRTLVAQSPTGDTASGTLTVVPLPQRPSAAGPAFGN
jgi:Tol biopolymer transport system component